jgi:hypothetical protein
MSLLIKAKDFLGHAEKDTIIMIKHNYSLLAG